MRANNADRHWCGMTWLKMYPYTGYFEMFIQQHQLASEKKCKDLRLIIWALKKCPKSRRTVQNHYSKVDEFVKSYNTLFDIIGDNQQIKRQENAWNVLMTEEDHMFYKNQRLNPRVGYCTGFVCRKSEIKDMRRIQRKGKRNNPTNECQSLPGDHEANPND